MKPNVENWPQWFAAFYPDEQQRWAVINAYAALGTNHPNVLTDIALRNYVFAPIREGNAHDAAIAEGRRQCALEIFKLCNVDPASLFGRTRVIRNEGKPK